MTAAAPRPAARLPFALLAAAAFGAVAAALVSQHAWAMEPCAWCVLQRLVFAAIGVCAVLGIAWPRRAAGRAMAIGALLLAFAGAAAALWQHFVAARSVSCNLTFADRLMSATGLPALLPDVFEARASCADAAVQLFGVAYDVWSMLAFAVCALLAATALRRA